MPTFQDLSQRLGALAAPKQAAIFITHLETPRILGQFARIAREAAPVMPVFLCVHRRGPAPDTGVKPDFVITDEAIAATMPHRYALMESLGRTINSGFVDAVAMPALTHESLREYEHLWLIEFDVDYSGNWGDFFAWASQSHADLIGDDFRNRVDYPDFYHWPWFTSPHPQPLAPEDSWVVFIPFARFSREMIDTYRRATAEGWTGHPENLFPSIAWDAGLSMASISGMEPFSDPILHGVDGQRQPRPGLIVNDTFRWRPPVSDAYFHEVPTAFSRRNHLYHPVKVNE